MINDAKWIWADAAEEKNQYADFVCDVSASKDGSTAVLQICAESEYAVWLNGRFIGCGQYDDYPDNRHFDTYSFKMKSGQNRLLITAYHQGETSMQYYADKSGVCFALSFEDKVILSDENIMSAISRTYASGEMYKTTQQLGYGYKYSSLYEEYLGTDLKKSAAVNKAVKFSPRPLPKLNIGERCKAEIVAQGYFIRREKADVPAVQIQKDYLSYSAFEEMFSGSKTMTPAVSLKACRNDGVWIVVDLGKETCGFFQMELETTGTGTACIGYGEHVKDLRVRTKIDARNFADEYAVSPGRKVFTHYFRRIAGRYIQIHFYGITDLKIHYVGILPAEYPLKRAGTFWCSDNLHNKIYDVCTDTLKNCIHEHYEDCPWREQALYASDSRNQILCGYYAFGEFDAARESIRLLAHETDGKGFQRICAPTDLEIVIPSFTMLWFLEVKEYIEYSGDRDFLNEIRDKMENMIEKYCADGDFRYPTGEKYWHFYEWSDGYNGYDKYRELHNENDFSDGMYMVFLYIALTSTIKLAKDCGNRRFCEKYNPIAEKIKNTVNSEFWNEERGLYASYIYNGKKEHYGELMQIMAMYSGIAENKHEITDALYRKNVLLDSRITLSYSIYKYDVLMSFGGEYEQYVLDEIAEKWGRMLYDGATSFWETESGEADFDRAGSLCHGWSGIPVYIYFRYIMGISAEQISGRAEPKKCASEGFYRYKGSYTAKDTVYMIEKTGDNVLIERRNLNEKNK